MVEVEARIDSGRAFYFGGQIERVYKGISRENRSDVSDYRVERWKSELEDCIA